MHIITRAKDYTTSSLEACKRFIHIITILYSHLIANNTRGQYNGYTSGSKYIGATTGRKHWQRKGWKQRREGISKGGSNLK